LITQRYDEYLPKIKLNYALTSLLIGEYPLPLQLLLGVLEIVPRLQLVPDNLVYNDEVCALF